MLRIILPSPKFLTIHRNIHTHPERKVSCYCLERLSSVRVEKNKQGFSLVPRRPHIQSTSAHLESSLGPWQHMRKEEMANRDKEEKHFETLGARTGAVVFRLREPLTPPLVSFMPFQASDFVRLCPGTLLSKGREITENYCTRML